MIKLSNDSLFVLKKCLQKRKPSLLSFMEKTNRLENEIEFYNELRQVIGNELISEGFDENYEPNEYGLILENLIDEIGR